MAAFIMMMLILIGIIGSLSYAVFAVTHASHAAMDAVNEHKRLSEWEVALRNNFAMEATTGAPAPLVGIELTLSDGQKSHGLPDSLGLPVVNVWGESYVYCPFATRAPSAANGVVSHDSENAYDVETQMIGDYEYVVASTASPLANAMAVIVSPIPGYTTRPKCTDVSFQNGNYVVANGDGLAVVISLQTLNEEARKRPLIVNLDAGTTIDQIAAKWNATQPEKTFIYLESSAGPYIISDATFANAQASKNKEIQIIGTGGGSAILSSPDGSPTLSVTGATLRIAGVSAAGLDIHASNSSVLLDGSTLGSIDLENGSLLRTVGAITFNEADPGRAPIYSVDSSLVQGSSSWGVAGTTTAELVSLKHSDWSQATGASTQLTGVAGTTLVALRDQSRLSGKGDWSLNANSGVGMYVEQQSALMLDSAGVQWASPLQVAISASGELSIKSSTLASNQAVTAAIAMGSGAVVNIEGSAVGTSSTPVVGVAIYDNGAGAVRGGGTHVYSTALCWSGNIFTSVPSQTAGTSSPADPYYSIGNASTWSCN